MGFTSLGRHQEIWLYIFGGPASRDVPYLGYLEPVYKRSNLSVCFLVGSGPKSMTGLAFLIPYNSTYPKAVTWLPPGI